MHTVLFDTGPEGEALAQNCDRLGVDLGHTGGLLSALDLTQTRSP